MRNSGSIQHLEYETCIPGCKRSFLWLEHLLICQGAMLGNMATTNSTMIAIYIYQLDVDKHAMWVGNFVTVKICLKFFR